MASSSQRAFTSATAVCSWKYEVFLSFRGEDTRRGFTDYLYKQLDWRGIRTFRDDPDLERGADINPELLTAIEQSRFAIIVLSTNYASSSWCLRELTHIVQSMKEKERIFPIFYDVDPSDVRHQRGSFGTALINHERNCGEDREEVLEWRNALKKVADLAGWNSKDYRYDTELIKKIVDAVWDKVHPSFSLLDSSEILVGLDIKLEEIDLLLDTNANDVRFVGIWGMGGMGKTTLARLVYETISHNFEGSSFLANVREVYATHGLVPLQKQLLSNILREKNIQVYDAYSGLTTIKRCLCNKKVLLVLDDVDQSDQLEMLIREKDCFGLGSRIIITTRDEHLFVEHGIEKVYKVMPLTQDEALYLFSRKAFRKDDLEEDYLELSKNFINYAGGLPLALKTLGSFLYKRSRDEWKSALDKLKQAPDRKIFQMLKISYDGLEEMQKKIFLDVACFHKFYDKEEVIEILDSCGFVGTRIVIHVLIEKSLLSISNTCLSIHDLIQEMAWEIVRQESFDEPGGRSRLWLHSDIIHVLTNNTGTETIEGIVLRLHEFEAAHWNPEAFTKMCKLRLLKINNLRLSLGPKYLPNSLRILEWSWYPSKCLPPSFQPVELAELRMQHSKIDHLWNGIKYMVKLKSIDLSYSENLTRTPDFTGTQNLERLVFEGCTNLVKIHPSIASLKRLRVLNFKYCKSIKSLPSEVELESLETFDLSGCSKVKKIPEFVGEMKNFSKLSLNFTAVEQMPSSNIHSMASLKELDMSGISMRDPPSSLVPVKDIELPRSWHSFFTFGLFPRKNPHPVSLVLASLKDLRFLKRLNLNDCNLCEGAIPEDIGLLSSLEELNLDGNHFVSLPASISGLSNLRSITLKNCKRLQKLPSLPSNGPLSIFVNTDNCTSLKIFPDPTPMCNGVSYMSIRSLNCFSLIDHQGSSSIIFLMLKKFLQEIPRSLSFFYIIIPGSEIPEWFNNQSVGDSVIETLPSDSNSKWVGFAFCALFVPAQEISATATKHNLISFHCLYDDLNTSARPGYVTTIDDVASDHLWLLLLSRQRLFWKPRQRPETYWREKCHDHKMRFHFEARSYPGEKTWVKVKKCGVRALFEQDAEELNRTMKQYSNKKNSFYEDVTDCDFDKSDKVQGAITKRTREQYCTETGPSGIGTLGKESLCKRMKED
ncbi:PREDICTED: TMV resistance [Prunus dulcis]|uniref:ADP-ribosyl cyclase/cyclic ADP-ribose hydrolase n=1 Tax=Prunus dulcis TaxID=3755 RepID=A0A5E4FWG4_PRUDU|nr:disease resistance protein RUN1-like [Prunus dulcis]VVA31738.1 PREDICTED: TMV resistance [Prunus dulcis]